MGTTLVISDIIIISVVTINVVMGRTLVISVVIALDLYYTGGTVHLG